MYKLGCFVIYIICFFTMLTLTVSAYIDPSTTTYLVQIIAGVVVAGGALIGIFRRRIKLLFTKNKHNEKEETVLEDKSIKNENMFD